MKAKPITADELMKRLEHDEKYQERMRRKELEFEARAKLIAQKSQPVLYALQALCVHVDTIWDLAKMYAPLPVEIVNVLLEYLPRIDHDYVAEGMVRMLAATKLKYDGRVLAELFDSSDNSSLKWAIANTMECTKVQGINEWLTSALTDRRHGKAREMLCRAATKLLPKSEALRLLLSVFDDLPLHAAGALKYCGDADTVSFLESKLPYYENGIKKVIQKSIVSLKRKHGL